MDGGTVASISDPATAQRLVAIAKALVGNERLIPDHREVMRLWGGEETFHLQLAATIEALSAGKLTWCRVAPELVESDAPVWAMTDVANEGTMITGPSQIVGSLWVIDSVRSSQVKLKEVAAADRSKVLRDASKPHYDFLLAKAAHNLRALVAGNEDPKVRALVAELLTEPIDFEALVAAGQAAGFTVKLGFTL
jgi:hypothetical protein